MHPKKPFVEPARELLAGLFLGMVGMGIQTAWIIPPDDLIRIAKNSVLEVVANKALGFVAGMIFLLALWMFDIAFLTCFRLKRMSLAVQGSFAILAFIPAVSIPIHALFPPHLGRAGDAWLVWLLVIGFLAWHGTWLGIFLHGGHVDARLIPAGTLGMKRVSIMMAILISLEAIAGITFLAALPIAFGSNMNEFFWMWF